MKKPLRIFFAIGPEDVESAYTAWSQGEESPNVTCVTFSSQFFEICTEIGAQGYLRAFSKGVSKSTSLKHDSFTIDLQPVRFPLAKGIWFHCVDIYQGLAIVACAIRFRSDVVVLTLDNYGMLHWCLFYIFKLFNIDVITSFHTLLWHKFLPLSKKQEFLLKTGKGILSQATANLVCSNEISDQISKVTFGNHAPIQEFFSIYRPEYFSDIPAANPEKKPFRVLFMGRVERNKGVFDLLEIAKRFDKDETSNFIFDICGAGTHLDALRSAVESSNMGQSFLCHGWCKRETVQEMLSRSHVVIVPTRTDFFEGFNRVVLESVLAGRPVITSAVCPALSYVKGAAIEVPPDDVIAYGDALLLLYRNRQLYEEKQKACSELRSIFFDPQKSWKNILKTTLLNREK